MEALIAMAAAMYFLAILLGWLGLRYEERIMRTHLVHADTCAHQLGQGCTSRECVWVPVKFDCGHMPGHHCAPDRTLPPQDEWPCATCGCWLRDGRCGATGFDEDDDLRCSLRRGHDGDHVLTTEEVHEAFTRALRSFR